MLVAATVVFLYYTIWTLIMVSESIHCSVFCLLTTSISAFRRRWSSTPKLLSSTSLGYSNPRHPHPLGFGCCWFVLERCNDQKQSKEGGKGKIGWKKEGIRDTTLPLGGGRQIMGWKESGITTSSQSEKIYLSKTGGSWYTIRSGSNRWQICFGCCGRSV
jgi:hypothetical protein